MHLTGKRQAEAGPASDGAGLVLRPIESDDKQRLVNAFHRLGPEAQRSALGYVRHLLWEAARGSLGSIRRWGEGPDPLGWHGVAGHR